MTRKNKHWIAAYLLALILTTLSCSIFELNRTESWLCNSTGGEWDDQRQECDRQKGSRDNPDPSTGPEFEPAPGNESPSTGEEAPPSAGSAGHVFSKNDCSCGGINVPLNSSSAGNNAYKIGITSGGQVEVVGRLACNWQADYQSENLVGAIMVYLTVSKFDNLQYAQTLFTDLRNGIMAKPQYCKSEPERCTVAVEDFGAERAFYVYKNIYVGGRGELPSNHGGNMARLIMSAGEYYVLDLSVSHPELEMGDSWIVDVSQAVEACVMDIVYR